MAKPANSTLCLTAPSRQAFRPRFVFLPLHLVAALLLLLLVSEAEAWGSVGHEIVANLAWKLVSNETQKAIASILQHDNNSWSFPLESSCTQSEPCSPLALVADWADQVRYYHDYHWSAPLHYIDVRDDLVAGGCPATNATFSTSACTDNHYRCTECFFNYTRDCVNDVCVAGAIVNYTHRLVVSATTQRVGSRQAPLPSPSTTSEALKFLVHFVGDIHQPLHCSRTTDRGGNDIKVSWKVDGNGDALPDSPRLFEHVYDEYKDINTREQVKTLPRLRSRARDGRYREDPRGSDRFGIHRKFSIDNLHAVWDDAFIDTAIRREHSGSRSDLEDQLYRWISQAMQGDDPARRWERWTACSDGGLPECTTAWGQESWLDAIRFAYLDERGSPVASGVVLSTEYYRSRLPVVRERLAAAGVRLAATLTTALAHSSGAGRQPAPSSIALS
jgi:hypothetical protein